MIRRFKVSNFRCLESADLDLSHDFNLIYGANASGKTSLLEALAYLGRGKSFRGASTSNLIRHGASEFVLFGERGDPAGYGSGGAHECDVFPVGGCFAFEEKFGGVASFFFACGGAVHHAEDGGEEIDAGEGFVDL